MENTAIRRAEGLEAQIRRRFISGGISTAR
jgi:hypothetical protein